MYAAIVSEVDKRPPLVTPATIETFTAPHSGDEPDLVTGQSLPAGLREQQRAVR
jgi:hypothetical protein